MGGHDLQMMLQWTDVVVQGGRKHAQTPDSCFGSV